MSDLNQRLTQLEFLLQELQQWEADGLLETDKVRQLSEPYLREQKSLQATLAVQKEAEPPSDEVQQFLEALTTLNDEATAETSKSSEKNDAIAIPTEAASETTLPSEQTTALTQDVDVALAEPETSSETATSSAIEPSTVSTGESVDTDEESSRRRRWKRGEKGGVHSKENKTAQHRRKPRTGRKSRENERPMQRRPRKERGDSHSGEDALEAVAMLGGAGDAAFSLETYEEPEVVEKKESVWVRVLQPFLAQNWLYFLGTFLVLASGFYLLSLVWSGMNSVARHSVVWGGLGGTSVAFSAMAAFLYARYQLEEATRTFWFVGMGLLGIANISAGSALEQSMPLGVLFLGLTVGGYVFSTRLLRPLGKEQPLRSLGFLLLGQGILIGLIPLLAKNNQTGLLFGSFLSGAGLLWGGIRWLRKQLQENPETPLDRWEGVIHLGALFYVFLLQVFWGGWVLREVLTQPTWRAWMGPVLGVFALALGELAKAFPSPPEEDGRESLSVPLPITPVTTSPRRITFLFTLPVSIAIPAAFIRLSAASRPPSVLSLTVSVPLIPIA